MPCFNNTQLTTPLNGPAAELIISVDPPLAINGNIALNNTASSGNGTTGNPYILEDYVIDANLFGAHGIYIQNTDAHFILRNCKVTYTDSGFHGIYLENVTHACLMNNTVNENGACGIRLLQCNNNTLVNNTLNDNADHGIQVRLDCNNNEILNNTAKYNDKNGIVLYQNCYNNTVLDNIVNENEQYGIRLRDHANDNVVANNTVNGNNWDGLILLETCTNNTIIQNWIIDNNQIGIALEANCDYNNISFNRVFKNGANGIQFSSADYNTVEWNAIVGNSIDIQEIGSTGNIIQNNTYSIIIENDQDFQLYTTQGSGTANQPYILNNFVINASGFTKSGILINNTSVHFIIQSCTVHNQTYGNPAIRLENVSNGVLQNNIVYDNEGYGILLDKESEWNVVRENTVFNSGLSGIICTNSSNNDILDNIAFNNLFGIALWDNCHYTTIDNNTAYLNNQDGILLWENCGHNLLTENNASNNLRHGILLYIDCIYNDVINNIANNNDKRGIYLIDNCTDNTISGNIVHDNIGAGGISLFNVASRNLIQDNEIVSNNNTGIVLTISHNNDIIENIIAGHLNAWTQTGCVGNDFVDNLINHIELITPKNQSYYQAMYGYYPGSYGFESDEIGGPPAGFEAVVTLGGTVTVIPELDHHKKVLELHDTVPFFNARITKEFASQTSGSIEFWLRTDDPSKVCGFRLDNGGISSEMVTIRTKDNQLQYYDGSGWNQILGETIENDTWYHIRIDFECSGGGYRGLAPHTAKVWIDLKESVAFNFIHDEPGAIRMSWYTDYLHGQQDYSYWIDAIGFTWDPYYAATNNWYEGLFLNYQLPIDLTWVGFSFNGGANRTISGPIVLNLPNGNGNHTIQVFGTDLDGYSYQSELRHFEVDKPTLLCLHGWGGTGEKAFNWTRTKPDVNDNSISDFWDYYGAGGAPNVILLPSYNNETTDDPEFDHVNSGAPIEYTAEAIKNYIVNRHNIGEIKDNLDILTYSFGGPIGRYLAKAFYSELKDAGVTIRHVGTIAGPNHGMWWNNMLMLTHNLGTNTTGWRWQVNFFGPRNATLWNFPNNIWTTPSEFAPAGTELCTFSDFMVNLDRVDETPHPIIYNTYAGILPGVAGQDPWYNDTGMMFQIHGGGKDDKISGKDTYDITTNISDYDVELIDELVARLGIVTDFAVAFGSVRLEGALNNRVYYGSAFGHFLMTRQPLIRKHVIWDLRRAAIETDQILPENKTYYTPDEGNYPATNGFENNDPESLSCWFENVGQLGGTVEIVAEHEGHKNILDLYDTSTGGDNAHILRELSAGQQSGTFEYWMQTDNSTNVCGIRLDNGNSSDELLSIQTWNNSLQYHLGNGTWQDIIPIQSDSWYHIRVDFESSTEGYMGLAQYKWKLYVDNVELGVYDFINQELQASRIEWYTDALHAQSNYHYYIDAIGVSWDSAYSVGDNLEEGLLLNFYGTFTPAWAGFSLDGQSYYERVLGNVTIPMPEEGSHVIEMFGQTTEGLPFQTSSKCFATHHEFHLDIINHTENGVSVPPGLVELDPFDDLNISLTYQTRWGPTLDTWTNVTFFYKINESSWNGPFLLDYGSGMQTSNFLIRETNYSAFDRIYYYFCLQQTNNSPIVLETYYWTQDGIKYDESEARTAAFQKLTFSYLYDLKLNYSVWYKSQLEKTMDSDKGIPMTIYPWKRIVYQNVSVNFNNVTSDLSNYSVSSWEEPDLGHYVDESSRNISKIGAPGYNISQGIKCPFALSLNVTYVENISTIIIPEIVFDSPQPGRNLTFTGTSLNLTFSGIENWPSSSRWVFTFQSNTTIIRFERFTGIMVYYEHSWGVQNASQTLIMGLTGNGHDIPINLVIDAREEIVEEGISSIPIYLMTIVHDPPGDHSHAELKEGISTSFGVSLDMSPGMNLDLETQFYSGSVGEALEFNASFSESQMYNVEITFTYEQSLKSSVVTNNPALIGPGRGDLYYGVNLQVRYQIKMVNYYIVVNSPDIANNPEDDIKVWENRSGIDFGLEMNTHFREFGGNLESWNMSHLETFNIFVDNAISAEEQSLVELLPESPWIWTPGFPTLVNHASGISRTITDNIILEVSQSTFFLLYQEDEEPVTTAVINESNGKVQLAYELSSTSTTISVTENLVEAYLDDDDGTPLGQNDQFFMDIYWDSWAHTLGYIIYEDFTYTSYPYEIGTRDRRPPTTSILLGLEPYIHGTVILNCTAIDEESGVDRVNFYYDDDPVYGGDSLLIGYQPNASLPDTSLYQLSWNTTVLSGSYYIFAVTYDDAGNSLISEYYEVEIDNILPTVCDIRVYPPFTGAIPLYADCFDADSGISYVEYWSGDPSNPSSTLLGVSTASSNAFKFIWATDPSGTDDGVHYLYALAYDQAGNSLVSAPIEVTVDSQLIDGGLNLTPIWVSILIGTLAIAGAILMLGILRRSRPGPPLPPKPKKGASNRR